MFTKIASLLSLLVVATKQTSVVLPLNTKFKYS